MIDELKRIESINKKKKNTIKCQSILPFILLLESNKKPFFLFGISRQCCFKSLFFTVKSVDEKKNCAVLELLFPCSDINEQLDFLCDVKILFRTKIYVVVDLSCFCGMTILEIPVFDCLVKCNVCKDKINFPFNVKNENSPCIIWTTKQIDNTATITIQYNDGMDSYIEVILMTGTGTVTIHVFKGECRSVTVKDILSIEISKHTKEIEGNVEIQFNSIKRSNVYF